MLEYQRRLQRQLMGGLGSNVLELAYAPFLEVLEPVLRFVVRHMDQVCKFPWRRSKCKN